jgi:hypothetical protein
MTKQPATYTRNEAMQKLGITSRSAFHSLRRRYPQAFIIIVQGSDPAKPTLYDQNAIDRFVQWRDAYRKDPE